MPESAENGTRRGGSVEGPMAERPAGVVATALSSRPSMPIYTKTGDGGDTGLFDNRRVRKHDPRIECYGTVDELNSFLGLLRAEALPPDLDLALREVQETLFEIGADLATPGGRNSAPRVERGIVQLEGWIDAAQAKLPALSTFVLPAGHRESALLHVCRTVCRRAERGFWLLHDREAVLDRIGVYLNRLSDLLFVWARAANHRHGKGDVAWRPAGG